MTTEYPKATYVGRYVDDSFKLAKFFRVLRKRWFTIAAVSATVFASVTYYTFTRTPQYRSTSSLLINNSTIAVSDIQVPGLPGSSMINLGTEVSILRSRSLIEVAVSKMKQSPATSAYTVDAGMIMSGLEIRPEKDALILRLTYTDSDPKRAREVLNALSETYVEYSLKDRRTKSSTAINFIQGKLPQVKQQLDKSALAVTQFRKTYNIVDPETYAASVYKMREALEMQAQDLQIKIAQVQQQYESLSRQVGKSPDAAIGGAILQQDIPYQSLVKQFQEVETNYFLERTRFREDHPTVLALKDRRDELYRLLETRAQSVVGVRGSTSNITNEPNSPIQQTLATQLFESQTTLAVSQAQLESIRTAQSQVSNAFSKIPQIQQRYVEIQRQLALDTTTYNKLTEKLEELRISEAQEISSWKVLEPPLIPTKPSSPDIERSLITGAIAGLALGVLLALLQNLLDQRIREVEEVRELIDVPLLGSIPMTDVTALGSMVNQSILPSSSYYAFREALSSLALNLRYLGADNMIKVIAFTSSIPSEGKSTLTYNLATILAALGHQVLLVDADMRKPTIHKLAKITNKTGLSTALATPSPWQDLIQAVDDKGNLHVLTSGSIPPNPMLLLESAKMTALLQEWRKEYDYVLVDTPPVIGITDAQCLTSKVDTFILVAAINRSTRNGISRALEVLSTSRANVSGLLINMIGSSDSEYHYGYYDQYYLNPTATEDEEADSRIAAIESSKS